MIFDVKEFVSETFFFRGSVCFGKYFFVIYFISKNVFFRNLTFFPGGRFCLGNGFFSRKSLFRKVFFLAVEELVSEKGLFFAV